MLLRLCELELNRVQRMSVSEWAPLFREEILDEVNNEDQRADCNANQSQGSYSASERCTAHSQNSGKFLAAHHDKDPPFPHLSTDIPLSSTNCDDGEREDEHVGTLKRVTKFRWDGSQREKG